MKRTNVAKRFGIVSLCLGLAVSAFSGIASFATNVALAEETVQTTDFVHATPTATVTQDENGLRISSDDTYKAMFKTVFDGNMKLTFKFPEAYDENSGFYGDFTFRIADATNESNYFDITYYVVHETQFVTGVYVQYQDELRMTNHNTAGQWYNTKQTNKTSYQFAPCFLTKNRNDANNDRAGILSLVWVGDVLTVNANTAALSKETTLIPIASFDGTYDSTATNNGFVGTNREVCGLPKMNFENGYTVSVSSSFYNEGTQDNGTDVLFTSIISDETYNLNTAELTKNSKMEAFDTNFEVKTTEQAVAGKVFLGYENTTTKKLYPAYSVLRKVAGQSYEPVVIDYDTINGASVRVDTSENSTSGIRFQTLFNTEEYVAIKDYIQEFGTLIAYTDTLIEGKDFTLDNYYGASGFAQAKNTKGTFAYTDKQGNTYTAYSMALINIADYTQEYSARGYLVVKYADGSTQTVYTDYNEADNSRSIAEVANLLKTTKPDSYNAMTNEQKAIIDTYAAAYGASQE